MSTLRYAVAAALSTARHSRGLKDLLVRRGELASDPRIHLRGVASTRAGSEDARAADRAAPAEVGTSQKPKELVMLFTCGQCNTRAAKAFSKDSYERGVVIVECPGCSSKHLIADHMGWFGSKGTVEDFAKEKGNVVMHKLADGTLQLTPEDVLGQDLAHKVFPTTS